MNSEVTVQCSTRPLLKYFCSTPKKVGKWAASESGNLTHIYPTQYFTPGPNLAPGWFDNYPLCAGATPWQHSRGFPRNKAVPWNLNLSLNSLAQIHSMLGQSIGWQQNLLYFLETLYNVLVDTLFSFVIVQVCHAWLWLKMFTFSN